MANRKPLPEGCDGSIWCQVEGHVPAVKLRGGRHHFAHIALTPGQTRTLRERKQASIPTTTKENVK